MGLQLLGKFQVLVIRPPTIINNMSSITSPSVPIGLAYVVGAIDDLVDIEAIDGIGEKPSNSELTPFYQGTSIMGLSPEETVNLIKKKPDVCLISSMFSVEWPLTKMIASLIKKKYPECIIIGGGEHFSALPDYSLENSEVDCCVIGEGEATARELIKRMCQGERLPLDVPGTFVQTS